jgi:leucine dehydrogenase
MAAFDDPAFDDHERVVYCCDAATGLKAIIAIHSTALGPAAGGCRLWNYPSADDALHDVLRLSQGMSYKNAMAGLDFGGGKAVIIKSADFDGTEALFEKFGEFVAKLNGDYVTAEDVGMSVEIMEMIARKTKHVAGLTPKAGQAGGDPSPKTALGIFSGIEAAVRFKLGRDDLKDTVIAVQGAGHVGYYLCRYLSKAGAKLIVADIDDARAQRICDEFGATKTAINEILFTKTDVLAPCALGAVLNERSIPKLKVSIVAGGANNQLETHEDGQRLADAGILYAPDYVINGGGIINVSCEYTGGYSDAQVDELVMAIGPRLTRVFEVAAETGRPTNVVADEYARKLIAAAAD